MWPKFRITREENAYCSKYEDPSKPKQRILRRIYNGNLDITPTIRQDAELFQISRRSRIFGMTASGDINLLEVQIIDISGEQYTTDFIPFPLLLCGTNWDSRSAFPFSSIGPGGITTMGYTTPGTLAPHIFEPNIVMAPNQSLSFNARPIDPDRTGPIHVSFCLHVWEFPGMPGSPL